MWVGLGLLVALGFSIQDILAKKLTREFDPRLVAWGWFAFALPFLWLDFFIESPKAAFSLSLWGWLVADTLLISIATFLYARALQLSDLSLVVPMLSFTPLFMLLTSRWMLGETPTPMGMVGVVLIAVGSYLLNIRHRHIGFWEPWCRLVTERGTRYALMTSLIYSVGANIDKIAVSQTSAVTWITYLITASTLSMGIYLSTRRDFSFLPLLRLRKPLLVLGGLYAIFYILQLKVIMMTLASYLVAVKRTSVMFSSVFGILILKESSLTDRLPGIGLMMIGVFLISFAK
jgi:uncharacterized membrane protein